MARQVKEGEGWRLGWNPDAIHFKGLVAGEHWALELTPAEFEDFCRLALQLADTVAAMAPELMAEERITCEVESDQLWLEAEGYPHQFSLRLLLLTGRRGEGAWPPETVRLFCKRSPACKFFRFTRHRSDLPYPNGNRHPSLQTFRMRSPRLQRHPNNLPANACKALGCLRSRIRTLGLTHRPPQSPNAGGCGIRFPQRWRARGQNRMPPRQS
jgi:hypothetical protein